MPFNLNTKDLKPYKFTSTLFKGGCLASVAPRRSPCDSRLITLHNNVLEILLVNNLSQIEFSAIAYGKSGARDDPAIQLQYRARFSFSSELDGREMFPFVATKCALPPPSALDSKGDLRKQNSAGIIDETSVPCFSYLRMLSTKNMSRRVVSVTKQI